MADTDLPDTNHVREIVAEREKVRAGQYGPDHDRAHGGTDHLIEQVTHRLERCEDTADRKTWVQVAQFALAALEVIDGGRIVYNVASPTTAAARPFAELRDAGLLWLVNRVVFHPRGHALALHLDDTGKAFGWSLDGDGREVWSFGMPEDDYFDAVRDTLAAAAADTAAAKPAGGTDV